MFVHAEIAERVNTRSLNPEALEADPETEEPHSRSIVRRPMAGRSRGPAGTTRVALSLHRQRG